MQQLTITITVRQVKVIRSIAAKMVNWRREIPNAMKMPSQRNFQHRQHSRCSSHMWRHHIQMPLLFNGVCGGRCRCVAFCRYIIVVLILFVIISLHQIEQVQSYMQLLWKEIDATETDLYNGAVEAAITLLGAVGAFVAGLMDSKKFKKYEITILTIFTVIEAALLMWSAMTTNLWACYVAYVAFGTIYHFIITVAR